MASQSVNKSPLGNPVMESHCPLCDAGLPTTQSGFSALLYCGTCANAVTRPAPSVGVLLQDDLLQAYRGQSLSLRPLWQRQARLRMEWTHLYQSEGAILEVGCGTGEFLAVALADGREVYGLEASESGFRHARQLNVELVQGGMQQAMERYADFEFDSVVLWDSLGYFPDPLEVLRGCRQLLGRRGRLFLEVPNCASDNALRLSAGWPHAQLDQRYCHFTQPGLVYLMAAAGFNLDVLLTFSDRIYCDPGRWKQLKNQALLAGHPWPSQEWIRVVASPAV